MKTIGNVLWLLIGGLISSLCWILAGILWCITIIGIPFGTQCFKIAGLVIWPIGKKVTINFEAHPFANIIWLILFGWEFTIGYFIIGVILCITVVGIPFGKQCFKLMKLSLLPFGATVR